MIPAINPAQSSDESEEDIVDATEILGDLRKLLEQEREENGPEVARDVNDIQDAIASLEKFVSDEKEEGDNTSESPTSNANGVNTAGPGIVDTGVLTGPITGLRNFLVKKQQDIQNQ